MKLRFFLLAGLFAPLALPPRPNRPARKRRRTSARVSRCPRASRWNSSPRKIPRTASANSPRSPSTSAAPVDNDRAGVSGGWQRKPEGRRRALRERGQGQGARLRARSARRRPATPSKPRVFAEGLAIPLGVLPYKNGCYVQHGADIAFSPSARPLLMATAERTKAGNLLRAYAHPAAAADEARSS